jgi:hypothetical protein
LGKGIFPLYEVFAAAGGPLNICLIAHAASASRSGRTRSR